ncbi:MAG: hypothetical protein NTY46_12415 [Candidatus Sumerlaeota bacterium]|nr:hypothetical protein [Candidatus Sumerlaeota bacterium]
MNRVLLTVAIIALTSLADAQTYSTDPMNNIDKGFAIPRRQKKTTPTPTASKPGENKPADNKQTKGAAGAKPGAKTPQTKSSTGRTSSTTAQRRPPAAAAKPGANAPVSAGQVKQITKAFNEFARTRKVFYDEDELAQQPGVVILNPRRYKPDEEPARRTSSPVNTGEVIARPL